MRKLNLRRGVTAISVAIRTGHIETAEERWLRERREAMDAEIRRTIEREGWWVPPGRFPTRWPWE